jgi:hypothetical protein
MLLADGARNGHPGLKLLFTSGYSDNALMEHGRLSAGVNLLQKPYRRAELARKLRQMLDGAGSTAPRGRASDCGPAPAARFEKIAWRVQ